MAMYSSPSQLPSSCCAIALPLNMRRSARETHVNVYCDHLVISHTPSNWSCVFQSVILISRTPSNWSCVFQNVILISHTLSNWSCVFQSVILISHTPSNWSCVFQSVILISPTPSNWSCVFQSVILISHTPSNLSCVFQNVILKDNYYKNSESQYGSQCILRFLLKTLVYLSTRPFSLSPSYSLFCSSLFLSHPISIALNVVDQRHPWLIVVQWKDGAFWFSSKLWNSHFLWLGGASVYLYLSHLGVGHTLLFPHGTLFLVVASFSPVSSYQLV